MRNFRDWPIALKLNVVQSGVLLVIIAVTAAWTSITLRNQLLDNAVGDLTEVNRLVVSTLDAHNQALQNEVERIGRVFAKTYGEHLQLVEVAGKPHLLQAGTAFDERLDVVDGFSEKAGIVATIFVRQGDDFLRSATSLKKEDGTRAIGTLLGPNHPAYKSVLAGTAFTGKATLFGKDYMTQYVPAKDASGNVVGIFFVGLDLTEGIKAVKKNLMSFKVGRTGYIYALDAGVKKGVLTIHPVIEGRDLLTVKDSRGFEFVREIVEKKTGMIRYNWANPGEVQSREKIAVFEHFPAWNWVIVSGSYLDEFDGAADDAVRRIILMALAIIVAAVTSGFLATRFWVSRPLRELVDDADEIAAGKLTRVIVTSTGDEVGQMKRAISKMSGNLQAMIGEIRDASGSVFNYAGTLVGSADQVSRGSEIQRNEVTGMAASVEELSVSIDEVARHANDARSLTLASGEAASQANGIVQQAVAAMNQITGSVRQAATTVGDLGRRSQDISAVVQVIREIADQTNLLALNAAIEAARAGEQGRGFAVVADEIRKLAERTALSTHSIREMIANIQDGADAAVRQIQNGVDEVEQGSQLADQAGQAIVAVESRTHTVADAVDGISTAVGEQSIASRTIAVSLEEIAQRAESSHEASLSTAQSAQALRDLATRLNEAVSRFQVN